MAKLSKAQTLELKSDLIGARHHLSLAERGGNGFDPKMDTAYFHELLREDLDSIQRFLERYGNFEADLRERD